MFSLLFHKDVFYPNGIDEKLKLAESSFKDYELSRHLQAHVSNREDRSHDYLGQAVINCLERLKTETFEAFEIEYSKGYYDFGVAGWLVTKYCVRIPYGANQDLVVVIAPKWDKNLGKYDGTAFIKTAWLNSRSDAHFTLDGSRYCDKERWFECQR